VIVVMRLSRYGGNQNVGVFAVANESIALIAADAAPGFVSDVQEALGVSTALTTVAGSFVIGSLVAMNSFGAVVSGLAEKDELGVIGSSLSVAKLRGRLNAAGNNILANDTGAIVNPDVDDRSLKEISDALGVKCVRGTVAGIRTVGSACKATVKGCVCHPSATDDDLELIRQVLDVEPVRTTLNHGCRSVGACVLANSKGALVGDDTTPIEMGKLEDALVLY